MADENTESAGVTRAPRRVAVIVPALATEGGYVPAIVTEGEPGYRPLSGQGDFAAPWVWGPSLAEAWQQARDYNERLGHDPIAVGEVLLSALLTCPQCRRTGGGHRMDCGFRS